MKNLYTVMLVVLFFTSIVAGCVSGGNSVSKYDEDGNIFFEIEDFEISSGYIVEDPMYSGGSAVLAESVEFLAHIDVPIEAGTYSFIVYLSAPDGEHDAIHLAVDLMQDARTFPAVQDGSLQAVKNPPSFTIDTDGMHAIEIFTTNEAGMSIDRVVLVKTE